MTVARVAAGVAVAAAAAGAQDTVRFRATVRIDQVTEPRAAFGDVRGLAVDVDGTVYAVDRGLHLLWAFDADGRLRGTIGGSGRGPGEFTHPDAVTIGPDGHLWVRDAERVQRLARDGRTGLLSRYASSFTIVGAVDATGDEPPRVDAASHYLLPGRIRGAGGPAAATRIGYVRYTAEGRALDTIVAPRRPRAGVASAGDSTGVGRGVRHDITPSGNLVVADTEGYAVRVVDPHGRLVRELVRTVPRAPVASSAVRAVIAAHDGRVWVRRRDAPPERTVYDVWSPAGRLESVVVLPTGVADLPVPDVTVSRVVAAVRDTADGHPAIVVFRR